ncbi:uncharacterized MFS-type transporter C09D4.1-like, partial [Copidosoma floridanum]|uniref:uncharacterized MFS-type transporter C09D4.1-like n=1 Tax=Copidosoma floridanum TaxID=29053 RepID=UPI000C6F91D8
MGNEDRSTKNSSASVIEVSPEIPNESEAQADPVEIKVYKKRWFILLQFTLLATGNKFQYLQYTIIQSIVTRYYDVSTLAVQSTVIVFNLSVPIMIYPCTLIMNRWGLRLTMILVSLSTCLGTWIKYIATSPDTFVLAVLGQTLVGAWQGVVISLPGILAARWFGPNEVATATGMGFVGQKVGMAAMSFLVPAVVTTEVRAAGIQRSVSAFVLAVLGQTLVGAWQGVVISLPGILAARWFGPNEVATATGMGFVGQK